MRRALGAVAVAVVVGCGASKAPPGPASAGVPCCHPAVFRPAGSCGEMPDGCGGIVSCGACPGGQDCQANACVSTACVPSTCQALAGACGDVPDGCGGTLHCGACASGTSCSGGLCVAPGERRGSTRWARSEGHGVGSVSIAFGHFAVLADGPTLETWTTTGARISSAPLTYGSAWPSQAEAADADTIVAGPSFVVASANDSYGSFIGLFDWSATWQRSVGGTSDYGGIDVPAVSAAGRIAWAANYPYVRVPQPSSLSVEEADGSNVRTWTTTDMHAGSVAFDPQGGLDVVVGAQVGPDGAPLAQGSFFGTSFALSGPELVHLDAGGDVRWTRSLPFSRLDPAIGTTAVGTIVLVGEGHFVAVERADGAVRFDLPAGGKLLAVDPKGRAAIAGVDSVTYYDLTGAEQWSRSFGGGADIGGVAIADDGSVVVVGSFQGTVDFGTGPLTAEGTSSGFLVDLAP